MPASTVHTGLPSPLQAVRLNNNVKRQYDMESNSVTKEVFILARQLDAIEKTMEKSIEQTETSFGYHSFAKSYNANLARAKEIFKQDTAFTRCISHLVDHSMSDDCGVDDYCGLRADVAVLKASLYSYFECYSPKEEKERIGFHV